MRVSVCSYGYVLWLVVEIIILVVIDMENGVIHAYNHHNVITMANQECNHVIDAIQLTGPGPINHSLDRVAVEQIYLRVIMGWLGDILCHLT